MGKKYHSSQIPVSKLHWRRKTVQTFPRSVYPDTHRIIDRPKHTA